MHMPQPHIGRSVSVNRIAPEPGQSPAGLDRNRRMGLVAEGRQRALPRFMIRTRTGVDKGPALCVASQRGLAVRPE